MGKQGSHYIIFLFAFVSSTTGKNQGDLNTQDSVNDLHAAGSSYSHQYKDWGGNYPGGYNFVVAGNGIVEEPYRNYDTIRENPVKEYPNGYYDVPPNVEEKGTGYHSLGGYGGYGGYGGNGGLNSYYGYNNPYYNEANHLGYGYYNKFGYGNIYSNGVTPNLVVGYRGYSRR